MSLLDQADVEIVAFRPERAGESVEGIVTEISSITSEYSPFPEIPVITVKAEGGVYRGIRGYHTTLRNELEKLNLKVGDRLAVRYDGKKPLKSDPKKSFYAYKVRSEPASLTAKMDDDEPPF